MDRRSGFTVSELLLVVAIVGLFALAAPMLFKPTQGSLQDGAALFEGFVAQARARAMATTSARRIRPVSTTRIVTESSASCSGTTWVSDDDLVLPASVQLLDTGWSLCLGDRGISTQNLVVSLQQSQGGVRQVEIMLGGTTRILP